MTVDRILYVAARIHDWNKSPDEIIHRSVEMNIAAEAAEKQANKAEAVYKDMVDRGLSFGEMLAEAAKLAAGAGHAV